MNNQEEFIMNITGAYTPITAKENNTADNRQNDDDISDEFNMEEWKKEQEEIRKNVYENLEEITAALQSGEIDFRRYLDVQATFMEYSASNALLILSKNANARKLGSAAFWKERGAKLKQNPEYIYILEKGHAYEKRDGSISTGYHPKKLFDISQTDVKPNEKKQEHSQRALLSGLIKDYPYRLEVVSELSQPVLINGSKDILYRTGLDFSEGFTWLAYTIAAQTPNQESQNFKIFKAWCVSYILCSKLDIEFKQEFDFQDNPLVQIKEAKAFRKELGTIRQAAYALYQKILAEEHNEKQRGGQ